VKDIFSGIVVYPGLRHYRRPALRWQLRKDNALPLTFRDAACNLLKFMPNPDKQDQCGTEILSAKKNSSRNDFCRT
jgi:hypothetical protein